MFGIGYLVYENGVYAAASIGYKTSLDGIHWTSAPGFSSAQLAYGNGVVVSLGSNNSWNETASARTTDIIPCTTMPG